MSGVKSTMTADWMRNDTHEVSEEEEDSVIPLLIAAILLKRSRCEVIPWYSRCTLYGCLCRCQSITIISIILLEWRIYSDNVRSMGSLILLSLQALFFWGWLGDRLNPKYVIAAGMVGSAITVSTSFDFSELTLSPFFSNFLTIEFSFQLTCFGAIPVWFHYYSIPYYIITYILFGLVQACGWPSEVAIMVRRKEDAKGRNEILRRIGSERVIEVSSWECGLRVNQWEIYSETYLLELFSHMDMR